MPLIPALMAQVIEASCRFIEQEERVYAAVSLFT